MLRILIFILSAILISGCVPIESKQILLEKPVALFDKNSVYKLEVPLANPKKADNNKYRFKFNDSLVAGYIEYASNNRYLATVDTGNNSTEQYDIVIEKFPRSFSFLSDYYIFVVNHIKKDNIKKIQNTGAGFYFFVEQSRSGDWYSYIPLWPTSRTIELSNRKELLEFAEKIFSQNRDKAAHEASFFQRSRSDIDYVQLRKRHAQQIEQERQMELTSPAAKEQSKPK